MNQDKNSLGAEVTDQGEKDDQTEPEEPAVTLAAPAEVVKAKKSINSYLMSIAKNQKEIRLLMDAGKSCEKVHVYVKRATEAFNTAKRIYDALLPRIPEEREAEAQELVHMLESKRMELEEFLDETQKWATSIEDQENSKPNHSDAQGGNPVPSKVDTVLNSAGQSSKEKETEHKGEKVKEIEGNVKGEFAPHTHLGGTKSGSGSGSGSEIDKEKQKNKVRLAELKGGWSAYEKEIKSECSLKKKKYLKEIKMLEAKERAFSELKSKVKTEATQKAKKKTVSASDQTQHSSDESEAEVSDDVFESDSESDSETSDSSSSSTDSESSDGTSGKNKKKKKSKKKKEKKSNKKKKSKKQSGTTVIMAQSKPYKFDGDPLKFKQFIRRFESRVEKHAYDYTDKLTLLQEAVEGTSKAEKVVMKGWNEHNDKKGYKRAIKNLKKIYEHPQLMSNAYLSRLNAWEEIGIDDGQALQELADYLEGCLMEKKRCKDLSALDTPPYITAVFYKLPGFLQNKWNERVLQLKEQGQMFPYFKDITRFVLRQAELMNDPVFGRKAVKAYNSSRGASSRPAAGPRKHSAASYATQGESIKTEKIQCLMCAGSHHLDTCQSLMNKSLPERKAFLIHNHLCFRCLRSGHIANKCTAPLTCRTCSRKHPTCLHYSNKMAPAEINNDGQTLTDATCMSASTGRPSESEAVVERHVYHAVIPVMIRQVGRSEAICTYAFLDSGSSACFVSSGICDELNVDGTPTSLRLRTLHGATTLPSNVYSNLEVTDLLGCHPVALPRVFSRPDIGITAACVPRKSEVARWTHLKEVAEQMPDFRNDLTVGLLIGSNCPEILEPSQIISSQGTGLFAARVKHGWTVQGSCGGGTESYDVMVNRVAVRECENLREMVLALCERGFTDDPTPEVNQKDFSPEDRRFMQIVEEGTEYSNGHYVIPLPLRNSPPAMPNNRSQAVQRARSQARKFIKDAAYKDEYTAFIQKMLDKGYARLVTDNDSQIPDGSLWYLPHHGVLHPAKRKLRVVFDGAACFGPLSLNTALLQGPNMANTITGVMTRFRQHNVATTADIESMFHQVRVPWCHQSMLRFVWWPEGDITKELKDYCMQSHIFGSVSSPSVAAYALRRTADEHAPDEQTRMAIHHGFYVDDWLMSCPTSGEAMDLAARVTGCCQKGGFRLTKFLSNSPEVMLSVPESERAESMQTGVLDPGAEGIERTLGLFWHISSDTLRFSITIKSRPFTRRGVLSAVSSVYDPLGVLAPALLTAKLILQSLCRCAKLDWDDELPMDQYGKWERWLRDLPRLNEIQLPRSFGLSGNMSDRLHVSVYADASLVGQAAVAYLELSHSSTGGDWAFIAGKARVAPLRAVATVPKMELAAAVTAVNLASSIASDLQYPVDLDFYSDSEAVLKYLANEHHRQSVYVSNRVRLIRGCSELYQWHHVASTSNPADVGSRGLSPSEMVEDRMWLHGPPKVANLEVWEASSYHVDRPEEEETGPPPKPAIYLMVRRLLAYYSTWSRALKAVVYLWKFVCWRREKHRLMEQGVILTKENFDVNMVTTSNEASIAERALLIIIQQDTFDKDYWDLMADGQVRRGSRLAKFSPFLDAGLVRVGGRLQRAELDFGQRHPVILPRDSRATILIIRAVHSNIAHAGRAHTLSQMRNRFWVLGGSTTVRKALHGCVICKKVSGDFHGQIMAGLPAARTSPEPPFTNTGIDYFGPFLIKRGRVVHKRYGAIFTCLGMRACHLEVSESLQTDSFILALRRFLARRGAVRCLYSDNGSNFIGAERELARSLEQLDQSRVQDELRQKRVQWCFNPPYASHAGGVWERQIRTVRKHLNSILAEFPGSLTEEGLRTVMCEIEAIINSRPLTAMSDDPEAPLPLTPEMLLTQKTSVACSSPGLFPPEDVHSRKIWRRVQHIADTFWSRWTRDYLSSLQPRSKWTHPRPDLCVGDVVLVKDEVLPRGQWPVGIIIATHPDDSGRVRTVTLRTTRCKSATRSVHKLVYLFHDKGSTSD